MVFRLVFHVFPSIHVPYRSFDAMQCFPCVLRAPKFFDEFSEGESTYDEAGRTDAKLVTQ